MVDIVTIENQKGAGIAEAQQSLTALHAEASAMVVTNDDEAAQATAFIKQIRARAKTIKDTLGALVKPLTEYVDALKASFKPNIDFSSQIEKIVSDKLLAYASEQRRIKEEAELKRREEEKKKLEAKQETLESAAVQQNSPGALEAAIAVERKIDRLETKPVTVKAAIKGAAGSATTTKRWTYEIVNPAMVPREYCEPAAGLIRDAVNSGTREIHGVRIYEKETLGIR